MGLDPNRRPWAKWHSPTRNRLWTWATKVGILTETDHGIQDES